MKVIRWVLGLVILFFDFVFTPRGVKREVSAQVEMDNKTKDLALYQFKSCPFCVKVRREMKRNTLNIETRDALNNPLHRQALLLEGGKIKVPCLRINEGDKVTWLYESNDIVDYLQNNVAGKKAA